MSNNGFFGEYGGKYVPEILRRPVDELEENFYTAMNDRGFIDELDTLRRDFIGRPTPLLYAERTSQQIGGARIYIKMEGLAHTGAHKINNAVGQALLAKRARKNRIIAETGAGQHGLATAAACARLGLECVVYMGEVDVRRQQPNVAAMETYGARVVPVTSGSRILKDAINEAMRDWAASFENTHYLIGSALGPAPFPDIVRTFQSVIGREALEQSAARGLAIDVMVACAGGGSNAMGFFEPFIDVPDSISRCGAESAKPRLIAVEAGGKGGGIGNNAVRMSGSANVGIVQGYKSRFLLDEDGQVAETSSISAGLDYAGIGPQLAYLGELGRVEFMSASDEEALDALKIFARNEGVIFALESAHAAAAALTLASGMKSNEVLVVNMSGRGDKDIFITSPVFRPNEWKTFLESELERLADGSDIHHSKPMEIKK